MKTKKRISRCFIWSSKPRGDLNRVDGRCYHSYLNMRRGKNTSGVYFHFYFIPTHQLIVRAKLIPDIWIQITIISYNDIMLVQGVMFISKFSFFPPYFLSSLLLYLIYFLIYWSAFFAHVLGVNELTKDIAP